MRVSCIAATLALSLYAGAAVASPAPSPCQDQFFQQAPDVSTSGPTHVLCFSAFGVLESGVTKTPLWSAEHLTKDRVLAAKQIKRLNKFHSEKAIPPSDRATLKDYLGSHYDRGHMSPDDDMPDAQAQFESFSLANMVPQDPCNNEIIWKAIETSVRNYVLANGDVYVVTGPIFTADVKTIGPDEVRVPTKLFKAVYDPAKNAAIVVITDNMNVTVYQIATLDQLQQMTGISAFPAVHNPSVLTLPPLPNMTGSCKKGGA